MSKKHKLTDEDEEIIRRSAMNQEMENNPLTKHEIAFQRELMEKGITGEEAIKRILEDVKKQSQ